MTHIIKIPTANLRHSTMANSQEVYLGDSNNYRQSEMAAETGNTYISESMWGTVKIPTTRLRFETMYRWKIVLASDYNSDRQRIYRYAPKPEIITFLELWQIACRNSNVKFGIFDDDELDKRLAKWLQQRSTTRNCKIGDQNVYVAVSGCRSLLQSPGVSFFALGVVVNPRLTVGIVILSVIVPKI